MSNKVAVQKKNTKQHPHSVEAEEAVLGSVLINPDSLIEDNLLSFLDDTDFYIHRNQWVWGAIRYLFGQRIPIDLLTISERLEAQNQLSEIGGSAYLTSLINQVPSSLNALAYAHIVKGHAERRKGIYVANKIATAAYDESIDFDLSEFVSQFNKTKIIGKRITTHEASLNVRLLLQYQDYCSTGMKGLDKKIGGLFKQELSVWGGYQGTGKSGAMIQAARANSTLKKKTLLCSLEMNDGQVWLRMACGDLGLDVNHVRAGMVSQDVIDEVTAKADELATLYEDYIIIYNAPMSPIDILSAVIYEKPDLVFVDTLKNVKGKPQRTEIRDWYDYVLEYLRSNVAKEQNCHVAVLHHISRSATKNGHKPTKHDLMFAGESDADLVILLHRPDEAPNEYTLPNKHAYMEWIVDKSRFGWVGSHPCGFNLANQNFYSFRFKEDE